MSRFTNPVPQFWLDDGSVASAGRMYFFENKNYSTPKATYSKPDNTVPNTHPVKLDGQGRMPPCHGEGLYSVKFYAANPDNPNIDGALQWTRDDVSLSELTGQFDLWSAAKTYTLNDIVKDPSDGFYYQLWGAPTSTGEQPSATLQKWEKVVFITEFNPNKTYKDEETVSYGGRLYSSNQDDNEDIPPSVKWDNLTFNNSIDDDLTVTGSITAGGNISFIQDTDSYIPVAEGSSTAGVGTYSIQEGMFVRNGRLITGVADLSWSAHTGTGNIDITLPIAAANDLPGGYAGGGTIIRASGLTWAAGKQLTIIISQGFTVARILGIESGASPAQIPMDTSASITIQFSYLASQ